MDQQQSYDEYEYSEQEQPSKIKAALTGTVLGEFLRTKERRYLVAFFLYMLAMVFGGIIIITAITGFPDILSGFRTNNNSHFFNRLFVLLSWIAGFMTVGAFCAKRYAKGFTFTFVTVLVIFITYARP